MHAEKIESEEFFIGDEPFCSIFLQTKCGHEEDVIRDIKDKISRIKIDEAFLDYKYMKILKCFGHFDIAIFFNQRKLKLKLDSFEKINQELIQIGNITDSNSIVGFSWDYKSIDSFDDLSSCWGISSIKLDLESIIDNHKNPIMVEKDIVGKIITTAKENNIRINIFGGLGWNEIIAVINSESLVNISNFVYKIRIFNEILDIDTLPAVYWGCWNSEVLDEFPNCQLLIAYRSRSDFSIREEIILAAKRYEIYMEKNIEKNSVSEDLALVFGGFDIRIPIIKSNLNNIIKYIMYIRKIDGVTKTNTVLSPIQVPQISSKSDLMEINKHNSNISNLKEADLGIQGNKYIEIETYNNDIKLIDALENEIRYLHSKYIELKNDSNTHLLYFDLEEFFIDLEANISKSKECDIDINKTRDYKQLREQIIRLEQLKKIIQTLEFSIYQRISGMQMTYLMEPKNIGFEKFGGIQRIILSIEAIPAEIVPMLSNSGWMGFCVFGSESDFIAHAIGEVLSIPFEFKYNPCKWWGLGHEIAHLLIKRMINEKGESIYSPLIEDEIKRNFETDIKNFKNKLDKIDDLYDEDIYEEYLKRDFELITQTIEELCADYLNFRIIFASDWKAFYECTLNYLDSRGYDILGEDRLFRLISISEYVNKREIENDVDLFKTFEYICDFDSDASIIFKYRLKIIKNQTYQPYIKTINKIFNKLDEKLEKISIKSEVLNEIDTKLNRGEVIDNHIDLLPIYILKALLNKKSRDNISFKYQISAILSLYNSRFLRFQGTCQNRIASDKII